MEEEMKRFILNTVLVVSLIFGLCTGCSRNVDYVKERSVQAAKDKGFEIIGYEGYLWSAFYGGQVWYIFRRVPDNGIIYHGALVRRPFTDEIHLGELKAIDAIKP
jgi:hypothetical protein